MDRHVKNRKGKTNREIKSSHYKKFTGNKSEGQGFADKRKQRILHQYKKVVRRENKKYGSYAEKVKQIYSEAASDDEQRSDASLINRKQKGNDKPVAGTSQTQKMSAFHKEEKQWKNKKIEEERRTKEAKERFEAKHAALAEYQKKKRDQHKLLARKNYKGQPNMASRMELLLAKIEKQTSTS